MARRKPFNVHELYPTDYCFNRDAFEADPERYVFTKDDLAYFNAIELTPEGNNIIQTIHIPAAFYAPAVILFIFPGDSRYIAHLSFIRYNPDMCGTPPIRASISFIFKGAF